MKRAVSLCLGFASHGVELYALVDTGATPNVMFVEIARKLSLNPEKVESSAGSNWRQGTSSVR